MRNVPKLRFNEFSGEWEEKKFGDIYSFYSTNSLSRDKLNYEQGDVKNIHYGDIHTKFSTIFKINNEKVPFINKDVDLSKIKDESYCKIGDLVIADASEDYADIGKTIELVDLNNQKVLAGLHTFLARPDKYDMTIGFVGYLLQSWKVRWQIMREAQGTKVLGLSTKRLANILLTVPFKSEQEKIATFLAVVDTKIEQLTKKEQLLQQYKKGVMQKIFNQEVRFKADDGSEFPDWEEKKLETVIEPYKEKSTVNNQYEVLTSSNKGLLPQKEYFGKNRLVERSNVGFNVLPEGYITYRSRSDNRNFTFNINHLGAKGVISTYYPVFKIRNGDNRFFIALSEIHKHLIGRYSVGTSQTVLSIKDLGSIKIKLPYGDEQFKIANFLSSLDTKIEQVQKQLESTKVFKRGLLQQMFV